MTYFPSRHYGSASEFARDYFAGIAEAAASVAAASLNAAADLLAATIAAEGTIYACGNGGSAAIANHLACDCLKGIASATSLKPRVVSLAANVEIITAIANDIGVHDIFALQLRSLAKPGDLLVAISSSGLSPNIVDAVRWAKGAGVRSLTMTGFTGGPAAEIADVNLHVAAHNYGVVEDVHQSLMHLLAQFTRHSALLDSAQLGTVKF